MKKSFTLVMAFVMLFTFFNYPAPIVEAAGEPSITFSKGDPYAATIVQGGSAGLDIVVPSGYVYGSTPFEIKKDGVLDSGVSLNEGQKTLTADSAASGIFVIRGNFFGKTATGTAIERFPTMVSYRDSNGNIQYREEQRSAYTDIISEVEGAITKYSTMSLKVTRDETADVPPEFAIETGAGKDPVGVFADFLGGDIFVESRGTQSGRRYLQLVLKKGEATLRFKLFPKQSHEAIKDSAGVDVIPKNDYVKANTTYDIDFSTLYSKEILLTVKTPAETVADVSNGIKDGVNTSKYILLSEGDRLKWITQGFYLVSETEMYGAQVNIGWEWDPEEEAQNGVVLINEEVGKTPWEVKLSKSEDDAKGSLIATVTFGTITQTANVPILVRGKGLPPFVQLLQKQMGTKPWDAIEPPTSSSGGNLDKVPTRMDVYRGNITGFDAKQYNRFTARINMGEKNAAAEYVTINTTKPGQEGVLNIFVGESLVPYKMGDPIMNPDFLSKGTVEITVVANAVGNANLRFDFYTKGSTGAVEVYQSFDVRQITVENSTPSGDNRLKSLEIKPVKLDDPGNNYKDFKIEYPFNLDNTIYSVTVPYAIEEVTLTPTLNHLKAKPDIKMKVDDVEIPGGVQNRKESPKVELKVDEPKKVELIVTAQDGSENTYIITFTRLPRSKDATLSSLELYKSDEPEEENIVEGFSPDIKEYNVQVPFRVKQAKLSYLKSHLGAIVTVTPPLTATRLWGEKGWVKLGSENDNPPTTNPTVVELLVNAEEPGISEIYRLNILRLPPSDNALLKSMEVFDVKDSKIPYMDSQVFDKDEKVYAMEIPYSAKQIVFKTATDDLNAQSVTITAPKDSVDTGWSETVGVKNGIVKSIKVDVSAETVRDTEFEIVVHAKAESDKLTDPPYRIMFTRLPPNDDSTLANIVITDHKDNVEVEAFSFNTETLTYNVPVPYATEKVRITPKPTAPTSSVEVDGRPITDGRPSETVTLKVGVPVTTQVKVIAESGREQIYTIVFQRAAPSNEARLSSLVIAGGSEVAPLFVPSKTVYSTTMDDGAKGIIITAVTAHPKATLKIDGKKAISGTPSASITILDPESRVVIEVTAEDGKTVMNYILNITNPNLIEKSSNADLKSLRVEEGSMSPEFKPSISTYDVAVISDRSFVDIVPRPADKMASIKVLVGRKEIGDESGEYSEYITDGENQFTIQVTSPDESTKREYFINVYRNEEDKQGLLKPIDVDAIDFTSSDVSVVDISKYSVVAAAVFTELAKHPDKVVIFQGNDYSLQFKGSDMKKSIPFEPYYDLGMSFSSPDEGKIMWELEDSPGNYDMEAVIIYFKHHGELPGKATLMLSLGKKYRDERLHWNYFNEERERIDYYGYFNTNSRGTFSLPITHFSNYIVTDRIPRGSENKTGMVGSGISGNTDINLSGGLDKLNPNTGQGRD